MTPPAICLCPDYNLGNLWQIYFIPIENVILKGFPILHLFWPEPLVESVFYRAELKKKWEKNVLCRKWIVCILPWDKSSQNSKIIYFEMSIGKTKLNLMKFLTSSQKYIHFCIILIVLPLVITTAMICHQVARLAVLHEICMIEAIISHFQPKKEIIWF